MSSVPKPVIEYVIFDMDGLMIDSEKIYTDVTNTILAPYGKEMTWDMKAGCMGKPQQAAAAHLLSFFPDIPLTTEDYLAQRNLLQDQSWPTVLLLPGITKLVQHLHAHNIPMAIATGSTRRNYKMKTGHLQHIFGLFERRVICADDDIEIGERKMQGKPNPDVFLVAAQTLLARNVGLPGGDVTDEQKQQRIKGLVFEDALSGMQAGKRAGMAVVWVPDANLLEVEYDGEEKADQTLKSLTDFVPEEWGLPAYHV